MSWGFAVRGELKDSDYSGPQEQSERPALWIVHI
jgi:hypothetical protein